MRVVHNFFLRPLGIAVAITQWIVLLFAVLGDYNPDPGFGSFYHPTALNYLMFLANALPLVLAHAISSAILAIFETQGAKVFVYILAAVPLITLQWLFFGSIIEWIFRESLLGSDSTQIFEQTASAPVKPK